jgi:serine protease
MNLMTRWRASVLALFVLCLSFAAAQAPLPRIQELVSDIAAPAIDRGIRDNDLPRAPRTSSAALFERNEPFLRGSLIVKFRAGTAATAQRAMLARVSAQSTQALSYSDFDIVAIDSGADPEAVARVLEAQPDVEYAQPRYRIRPHFTPNDQFYNRQWNYPAIDMERAWDINRGATPQITVAVLDSGVAYRSGVFRYNARAFRVTENGPVFPALGPIDVPFAAAPDLAGADRFVAPRNFIWDDTTPLDFDGHGTHVAGTIGQLTNNSVGVAGMAFNVRIMPIKVIDTDWDVIFGAPVQASDDLVARAIRYAVDNGAKVLNMSFGRIGPPSPVMQDALAYAVSRGAFVSISAGNDFLDGNPTARPADIAPQIQGVVAVAAIGRDRLRARYSNTGTYVELAAPGGDQVRNGTEGGILQQTYDFDFTETYLDGPARYRAPRFDVFTYQFFQGTSMAAPHVAGFAALLMQQGITSPAAIEEIMKRYATDLGAAGRDNEYGYGLINPRAALRGMGLVK